MSAVPVADVSTAAALDRALADRYFADVVDIWGQSALAAAGFFDDGVPSDQVSHDIWPLTTPTHKLTAPPAGQTPVVLLCTGAYSPPHNGHLAMFERARQALQAAGQHVAGGYLSPSHDAYVSRKYDGTAALGAAHRIRLCELAVAASDWLSVCEYEARWVATDINFTDVAYRLERYLRAHWHADAEVAYLCGGDNAGFARAFVRRGRCVVIPRAGHELTVRRALAGSPMKAARDEGRVVLAEVDADTASISSSDARSSGTGLPQSVAGALDEWGVRWGQSAARTPTSPAWYAVRDDLQWATSQWHAPPAALAAFRDGVCEALANAFAQASWPDTSRQVQVRLLDVAEQARYAERLAAQHDLLSLDVVTAAGRHLHLSRSFAASDGQVHPGELVARPGHPALEDQVQALPDGRGLVTVLDDDIATGHTQETVARLLADRGLEVKAQLALLSCAHGLAERPLDVVDLRDFLLGAREGGLVVRDRAGLCRVPYLAPWVSLVARAKCPPSAEHALARQLWQLNYVFHRATGLTVGQLDLAPMVAYGLAAETPAAQLCEMHLRHLDRLPFGN